jgi:hypothetical protein
MVQQSLLLVPGSPIGGDAPCQPGSGLGCVAPDSRIMLYPNGCRLACELCPGDILLTRDANGVEMGEAVLRSTISEQPRMVVETRDGLRLRCSFSHEVMVADELQPMGVVRRASDLSLTDRLLLEDGALAAIDSISVAPAGSVVLIVMAGPNHVYLSDGLWSHNKVTPVWP